jgi:hypothetical protein
MKVRATFELFNSYVCPANSVRSTRERIEDLSAVPRDSYVRCLHGLPKVHSQHSAKDPYEFKAEITSGLRVTLISRPDLPRAYGYFNAVR